ncbi:hypothetical protein [Paraburkholderia sp. BL9I2N2]|uniref:hypothetical protein n=1 Tax=Paraburkholderia sp. BL9I2N2 TaxID=1938809 RepID=UPI0014052A59|nr:hypothetical protein [Paraburkholderia sp. BL9I2N2]
MFAVTTTRGRADFAALSASAGSTVPITVMPRDVSMDASRESVFGSLSISSTSTRVSAGRSDPPAGVSGLDRWFGDFS